MYVLFVCIRLSILYILCRIFDILCVKNYTHIKFVINCGPIYTDPKKKKEQTKCGHVVSAIMGIGV